MINIKYKSITKLGISAVVVCSLLTPIAFASDTNFFLEKIATMQDSTKKDMGVSVLRMYLDTDNPDISSLKNIIKSTATTEDINKLKAQGYSLDSALNSLDSLQNINRSDAQKLIKSIEDSDLTGIKNAISNISGNKQEVISDKKIEESKTINEEKSLSEKKEETKENTIINKFKDIDKHWAKDDIQFLSDKGIIKGEDKEKFNPNGKVSRAEFAALMVRLLDLKQIKSDNAKFKDIKNSDWFYEYVQIAKENKIINGLDEENFAPNKEISREEMVAMIMRAVSNSNISGSENKNLNLDSFNDKNKISSWAANDIDKAVKLQIIKGKSEGMFDSKGISSRAEAATILKRVFNLIKK